MNERNWEQKLQDFEAKISQAFNEATQTPSETVRPHLESSSAGKFFDLVKFAKNWLMSLSTPIRVLVIIFGAIAILSLLNTVLRIVSFLMIFAILAIVGYFLFKSFKESKGNGD